MPPLVPSIAEAKSGNAAFGEANESRSEHASSALLSPADALFANCESIQTINYIGLVVVSTALGFYSGRQLSDKPDFANPEELSTAVESCPDESASAMTVSVVPSVDEIWSEVRQDVMSLVTQQAKAPDVKGQRENRRGRTKGNVFAPSKLGLQALKTPARHQLILLSLNELERSIGSTPQRERHPTAWREEVFEMIVKTYKAIGKQWLGYEPSQETEHHLEGGQVDEDNIDDEQEWENEKSQRGGWYLIEEKLPIYTVVVKYLMLPPQSSSNLPSHKIADDIHSIASEDSVPSDQVLLSVKSPTVGRESERSMSLSYGLRGGCLIASSPQIMEDLVLSIAELVALEYLEYIGNGQHLASADTANLPNDGWPFALQSSLYNTRTLERFRNQIFLGWWLHKNVTSVVAIFEDYHYLWGIQNGKLIRQKCFTRRSQELSRLKGWRLGVSYFLEALDAVEPLLKSLLHRIGDIVSFVLVAFIGRSLGLILKGIQSSIQIPWGKPSKP